MKNTSGISKATPEIVAMWTPSLEEHLGQGVVASLSKAKRNLLVGMAQAKAEVLMGSAGIESVTPETMANFFAMENFLPSSAANAGMAPNVANPGTGSHNDFVATAGTPGSGDRQYLVGLCIAIAARTIGLELVQTIPATSQNIVVDLLDVKYSGGDIDGTQNTNIHLLTFTFNEVPALVTTASYAVKIDNAFVQCKFIKQSREVRDGYVFSIDAKFTATVAGTNLSNIVYVTNTNIAAGIDTGALVTLAGDLSAFTAVEVSGTPVTIAAADHVRAVENYIPNQTTEGLRRTLTRSEADAGSDRTMELELQNESYTIGNRTFNGHIARLQFKRLEERGIDPVAYLSTAMKNEVSQEVNWQIISAARALGLQNHLEFQARGMNFNTLFAPSSVTTKPFANLPLAAELTDIDGNAVAASFADLNNICKTMQYETIASVGAAVCMIIKQAAYAIGTNSRYGDGDAVVLASGLAAYVSAAVGFTALNDKDVVMDSKTGAKQIGTLAGIKVYVDVQQPESSPYVTVLRTNQDITIDVPGVSDDQPILMPGIAYLVKDLISTVDLVPESTGGRKIIMDSETDLILVGRRPAAGYLTFAIDIALPGLNG